MSNPENNDLSAHRDGLERLLDFIRLAVDAKGCGKRAEELVALTTQAIEAQVAADRAQAAAVQEIAAAAEAKADAQRTIDELADDRADLLKRENALNQLRTELWQLPADLKTMDEQLRRQVMNFSGFYSGFDERMQSVPNWSQLARDILGKAGADAHFSTVEDRHFESDRVEHAPEAATIRRSVSRPPRPVSADLRT